MKKTAILSLLFFISLNTFAQKPKPVRKTPFTPVKTEKTAVSTGNEKEEFDKALALTDAVDRINALKKFIASFPKSAEKTHAQELIIASYAQTGDEKLKNGEAEEGVKSFKLAVGNLPEIVSDKLFSEILLQIPSSLFFRGQPEAAVETAQTIEKKISGNAKQLLGLATFYLSVENGIEAARLADQAIRLDPNMPAAYQTAGNASRLNFQLEDSAAFYGKALELNQNSTAARRSLAEMKRAVGKSDEAAALYREILAKDETNAQAQAGLALSLFDDNKQTEAETEMAKALAQDSKNLPLLVGAAYWYAAHNNAAKAIELAGQASQLEPRYVWAHVALARGYILQKRPLDAERELLTAQQYGNFPTLVYELASARLQAGFFREAAGALKNDFVIKDGMLGVKLGGRIDKEAKSFIELLAPERRASIFEPLAADSPENADRLKALLDFAQKLETPGIDDDALSLAADTFIGGDEPMKLHRQLFVARQLLEKRRALPKVTEIAQATIGKADGALEVPNAAAAAVLADAMYDSRALAATKNQLIIVPDIPRPVLSAILRGEIEEVAGWAAYQQDKTGDAVLHLKRAVSVLPEKSLFWHSSMWRLGVALVADGKDKEALDAYLKGYSTDEASAIKYGIVESLYKKVNGNTDGLEAKIGAKPALAFNSPEETNTPETAVQNMPPVVPPASETSASPEVKLPEPVKPGEIADKPLENPPALPNAPESPKESPAVSENTPKIDLPAENTPKTVAETSPATETKPAPVEDKTVGKPGEKAEIKPENITENKPQVKPEASPANNDNKPVEQTVEKVNSVTSPPENNMPKPLFEPVIIQVPPISKPAKPDQTENKAEKPEAAKAGEKNTTPENTTAAAVEKAKNSPDETAAPDISRPRVIITDNSPAVTETPKCTLMVSQENVTLINSGGSLGVIVGFENQSDPTEIKASSSSPDNVSIKLDESFGSQSGRSLFIIQSISQNTGEYKITIEAACGKKEILVKVR